METPNESRDSTEMEYPREPIVILPELESADANESVRTSPGWLTHVERARRYIFREEYSRHRHYSRGSRIKVKRYRH